MNLCGIVRLSVSIHSTCYLSLQGRINPEDGEVCSSETLVLVLSDYQTVLYTRRQ